MNIEELIKKCQAHNVKAQEALYRRFAPILFGVCLKYCKEKALAEDLFQESFITIFSKIHQYKFKGSFEGWLKRITINTVLGHYKKQKYTSEINEEIIEDYNEDPLEYSEYSLDELLKLIQSLPDQYRLVFNLYVLDGYLHKEISDILNISEGTSKSNLSRAKSLLRKKLQTLKKSCPNE